MDFKTDTIKQYLRKVRRWLTSGNRPYPSIFHFLKEEAGGSKEAYDGDKLEEKMKEADSKVKEKPKDVVARANRNWYAATWRDTRYATAGHRFLMVQAAHSRMRAWYETGNQAER